MLSLTLIFHHINRASLSQQGIKAISTPRSRLCLRYLQWYPRETEKTKPRTLGEILISASTATTNNKHTLTTSRIMSGIQQKITRDAKRQDKTQSIETNKHLTRVWRRQWHPTPVLLPGKSHGQRSLVGCSPWGRYELDTTEQLHFHFSLSCIGGGNGNPLQYSCLENPRDGGAWWAAVYGVAQSRTRLKRLSSSSSKKSNWISLLS